MKPERILLPLDTRECLVDWSNGHSVKMMIFDDSSLANHEKYYGLLEQTKTVNELEYERNACL
jgi:hypothetical protein